MSIADAVSRASGSSLSAGASRGRQAADERRQNAQREELNALTIAEARRRSARAPIEDAQADELNALRIGEARRQQGRGPIEDEQADRTHALNTAATENELVREHLAMTLPEIAQIQDPLERQELVISKAPEAIRGRLEQMRDADGITDDDLARFGPQQKPVTLAKNAKLVDPTTGRTIADNTQPDSSRFKPVSGIGVFDTESQEYVMPPGAGGITDDIEVAPMPPGASLADASGPVQQAVEGVANLIWGSVSDDVWFKEQQVSSAALNDLSQRSLFSIAKNLSGRPSVFSLQLIERTVPFKFGTDTSNQAKAETLLRYIDETLKVRKLQVEDPGTKPAERAEIRAHMNELRVLRSDWDSFMNPPDKVPEMNEAQRRALEKYGG